MKKIPGSSRTNVLLLLVPLRMVDVVSSTRGERLRRGSRSPVPQWTDNSSYESSRRRLQKLSWGYPKSRFVYSTLTGVPLACRLTYIFDAGMTIFRCVHISTIAFDKTAPLSIKYERDFPFMTVSNSN